MVEDNQAEGDNLAVAAADIQAAVAGIQVAVWDNLVAADIHSADNPVEGDNPAVEMGNREDSRVVEDNMAVEEDMQAAVEGSLVAGRRAYHTSDRK